MLIKREKIPLSLFKTAVDNYGVDQLSDSERGQKIAIIDAFGSPTIKNDVAVFDEQFKLPPTGLCVYYPEGTRFQSDPEWAGETSLDVEWAHALAPEAQIDLVAAKLASLRDLLTAVKYTIGTLGAQVVPMSWTTGGFPAKLTMTAISVTPGRYSWRRPEARVSLHGRRHHQT